MILASLVAAQFVLSTEPIQQQLNIPFDIWDVASADLNQDDQQDLIALYAQYDLDELRKGAYIYLAKPNGYYPREPNYVLQLDEDSGCAFITRREGRDELAVSVCERVTQHSGIG